MAKKRSVVLLGYSERGMVNAICDDMLHCADPDPLAAVKHFLSWCTFYEGGTPDFNGLIDVTILVEQSFSDFGDLDLLLLLDHEGGRKQAVLIEAKMATGAHAQWERFDQYCGGDVSQRSSLFVQLYRKLRLVRRVQDFSVPLRPTGTMQRWSLGNRPVVLKAARRLAEYAREPWYVALVPGDAQRVGDFFRNSPFTTPRESLPDWGVTRWGSLTWPVVYDQCKAMEAMWGQTLRCFDWNEIYPAVAQVSSSKAATVETRKFYEYDGKPVFVVVSNAGDSNCRVVPLVAGNGYFPKSIKVPMVDLTPLTQPVAAVLPPEIKPTCGVIYTWFPPQGTAHTPPRKEPAPPPPRRVLVKCPGWETSAVRSVTDAGLEEEQTFHVFTCHLRLT